MPWIPLRDGHQLHVRTIGRGEPVVLLHGFASNSSHWLPNVLPLAHKFRFILPDLRGFGPSLATPITEANVFQQYARDVQDVLDHFELERVMFGGISTGAYTCLTYNQLFGFDRISRYLNIEHSPEARIQEGWSHGLFCDKQDVLFEVFRDLHAQAIAAGPDTPYWSLPHATRRAFALTLARVLARAFNNSGVRLLARNVGEHAERLVAGPIFQVKNWYAYIQVMDAFMAGNDTRPWLHQITCPTTLMIGAQSRFFDTEGQLEIKRHVPHAEVVIFPKSGHVPMVDQPIAFQREFKRFFCA